VALFVIYLLWPIICVPVYIVSQLVLVFRTLEDRWPIGDIVFGTIFFAGGQVLLFAFSVTICNAIKHYIDGLFFFALCMLLSVMMVYKYWDDITREDLEFSVGSKAAVWEVKDPLLAGGEYDEDVSSDRYPVPPPLPGYPSSNASHGSYGNYAQQQQQPQYGFKQGGGSQPSSGYGTPPPGMGGAQKGGPRGYPPASGDRY